MYNDVYMVSVGGQSVNPRFTDRPVRPILGGIDRVQHMDLHPMDIVPASSIRGGVAFHR